MYFEKKAARMLHHLELGIFFKVGKNSILYTAKYYENNCFTTSFTALRQFFALQFTL